MLPESEGFKKSVPEPDKERTVQIRYTHIRNNTNLANFKFARMWQKEEHSQLCKNPNVTKILAIIFNYVIVPITSPQSLTVHSYMNTVNTPRQPSNVSEPACTIEIIFTAIGIPCWSVYSKPMFKLCRLTAPAWCCLLIIRQRRTGMGGKHG